MVDAQQGTKIVELMVLAAWADGHVAGSEAIIIQKLVNSSPLLAAVGPIAELSRETRARLLEKGMEASLIAAAAGVRDLEYRELGFQCCARVISADAEFAPSEEDFLKKLQDLFAFSVADMRRLLVLATREHR